MSASRHCSESHGVSFVSVTQKFNTTTSMGRLFSCPLPNSSGRLRASASGTSLRPRVGADELERIIVEAIRPDRDADGIATPNSTSREHTPSRSPGDVHDRSARDMVSRAVERIVVHGTEVEIVLLARDATSPSLRADGEASRVLRVPMPGPRLRDRKDIIIASDAGTPPRRLDRSLVLAVARGRTWAAALREGEYAGTTEIAGKCGLGESYVRRILRLAYLAPDILESIAEGRQPRGLTLERLLDPVPLAWAEQRQRFGFAVPV
jgi:hypothetical protein